MKPKATSISCLVLSAFGLLTIVIAVNSYFWVIDFHAAHDFSFRSNHIFITILFHSARGGICCNCRLLAGSNEIMSDAIKEFYQWYRSVEGTVSSIARDERIYSLSYPISYRFMPTSPAPLGFQLNAARGIYLGRSFWNGSLAVPYWFPATLFIMAAAALFRRGYAASNRRKKGQCVQCGYDRRRSPDRCPECGST